MKIIWSVNIVFPYPAKEIGINQTCYGGWLVGLFNEIKKNDDIELCIVSTYKGKELKKIREDNNTIYYLIPCKNPNKESKRLRKYCESIYVDFKPDLIHIHGTEYVLGKVFQEIKKDCKNIVTIQGLKSICANYYLGNIKPYDIIKNWTLRNFIVGSSFKAQNEFYKSGKIEKSIINNADAIIGRTTFDYANTVEFNSKIAYYKVNESLREEFYDKEWNIKNIEKHSVFMSQGTYPLKGLHVLMEAINILKSKYPDIKLYIAGKNFGRRRTVLDYLKFSDYQKYVMKLIKKYKLEKNIVFTGLLDAEHIVDRLLKTNVYIQASSIENSSNSLGEAMLMGVPCVASNVGGTQNLMINQKEGFLYPFGDYGQLAHYISKVFDDRELAVKIGKNASEHAKRTHNRETNAQQIIKIYKDVIKI